ncbi:metalloendoproteinase 1-like [Populus alba x Populus x berolinensis]|nr:metalloendoproteinase 1-like [Populus alba x Populus x berolinensis]
MAPKLSRLLLAFLTFFCIQSFTGLARILKSEHQQYSFSSLQKLEGARKGQTVEGLVELKQYLKRFGYYPSDSALKTYQNYFHLNVTGILDDSTIKQMMIPRCGMPDITPNNTKSKHTKFHMVMHYKFFDGMPKWPPSKYHLTYTFGSDSVQVVDMETLRSVCSNAFKKWSDVSQLTFQEASDGASANIDGRLHFDAEEKWSANPAMDQFDLESVAVHEIGHLLGLDHSSDSNAVMYSGIPSGTKKRDLAQDDIDGIHALYGNE